MTRPLRYQDFGLGTVIGIGIGTPGKGKRLYKIIRENGIIASYYIISS
jgi:hypothetical protein